MKGRMKHNKMDFFLSWKTFHLISSVLMVYEFLLWFTCEFIIFFSCDIFRYAIYMFHY